MSHVNPRCGSEAKTQAFMTLKRKNSGLNSVELYSSECNLKTNYKVVDMTYAEHMLCCLTTCSLLYYLRCIQMDTMVLYR